jgi:hypothetical protein
MEQGEQGAVTIPHFYLEFQVFVDLKFRPVFDPFTGCFRIEVEKKDKLRNGEGAVKGLGQLIAAFKALVYEGGGNITVGNDQFAPACPFQDAPGGMEVLVPVCGKEPGQGFGPQLCFALQGGTDKAAYGAIGGLKGSIKRGQLLLMRGDPGGGRVKTPAEQIELGGGSAAVAAFKNNKIAYNVHIFFFIFA